MKKIFEIPSKSGGPPHRVVYVDGGWKCDCRGFYYRHWCNHIEEAKRKIELKEAENLKQTMEELLL